MASISFAIIGKSTMETSSTNRTSRCKGLSLLCLKRLRPKSLPNKRCRVLACSGIACLISSLSGKSALALEMDSVNRAAAFPVGAANSIRKGLPCEKDCATSKANNLVTVVVLPVPGPPLITEKGKLAAFATDTFCQLTVSDVSGKS